MGLEFRVCRDAFFEYFYRCLVGVLSKLCCVADSVIDIVLELSFKCPCVSTLCEGVDMCFFGGYWLAVEWTSGVDGCSVSVCLPSSCAVDTCGESFDPQFTVEYLERLGPRTSVGTMGVVVRDVVSCRRGGGLRGRVGVPLCVVVVLWWKLFSPLCECECGGVGCSLLLYRCECVQHSRCRRRVWWLCHGVGVCKFV